MATCSHAECTCDNFREELMDHMDMRPNGICINCHHAVNLHPRRPSKVDAVTCLVKYKHHSMPIEFDRVTPPLAVVFKKMKENFPKEFARSDMLAFVLFNDCNHLIVDPKVLKPNDHLYFRLDESLNRVPPSLWDTPQLTKLGINFEDQTIDEFRKHLGIKANEVDERVVELLEAMDFLNNQNLNDLYQSKGEDANIEQKRRDVHLQHPIVKAMYLIKHYATHEGVVDALLSLLFKELGFYDDMLFPFPQLRLHLTFGGETHCDSKADFVVIDCLSFQKFVVDESKNHSEALSSEPQMVGEAVAAAQINTDKIENPRKKVKNDTGAASADGSDVSPEIEPILGMRVHGYVFYFYFMPIGKSILDAMSTCTLATSTTTLYRLARLKGLAATEGFSLLDKEDRHIILQMLSYFRQHLVQTVAENPRARFKSFN